jgi:hypothetical protein
MPRLQTKIEGRGNGIKTVIPNICAIAASLKRDAVVICKVREDGEAQHSRCLNRLFSFFFPVFRIRTGCAKQVPGRGWPGNCEWLSLGVHAARPFAGLYNALGTSCAQRVICQRRNWYVSCHVSCHVMYTNTSANGCAMAGVKAGRTTVGTTNVPLVVSKYVCEHCARAHAHTKEKRSRTATPCMQVRVKPSSHKLNGFILRKMTPVAGEQPGKDSR